MNTEKVLSQFFVDWKFYFPECRLFKQNEKSAMPSSVVAIQWPWLRDFEWRSRKMKIFTEMESYRGREVTPVKINVHSVLIT